MLKGIHPSLSPDLLKTLAEMGHGDEIVLADAHFPAHQLHSRVLRADGVGIATLLSGITPLFEFDAYVDAPVIMMQAVSGDSLDPNVEMRYLNAIAQASENQSAVQNLPKLSRIDRFDFYERAKQAYAIVVTGECAKYGNIILKKGVTPISIQ
ncbi:L-fucose mutarotase [Avibacterium paragallinarum]|uniref:L-fucose mutarotase n=1 Tax=Avibacterium paragallinarum TaxID=728 RepID=UPI0010291A7B|nr:L-fucose mutarotase [Avibacterium paragallinarum]RZN57055.1 L-fucose mutarotase [Avibacterium paragallinarum]